MEKTTGIVRELKENEIFVFGSNEGGKHGKGAALTAKKWGAKNGVGNGRQGQTYGIPTKDKRLKTLSLRKIEDYIGNFYNYVESHCNLTFLITEIGCGLAGYEPKDIAPLFEDFTVFENVRLPERFLKIIYSL